MLFQIVRPFRLIEWWIDWPELQISPAHEIWPNFWCWRAFPKFEKKNSFKICHIFFNYFTVLFWHEIPQIEFSDKWQLNRPDSTESEPLIFGLWLTRKKPETDQFFPTFQQLYYRLSYHIIYLWYIFFRHSLNFSLTWNVAMENWLFLDRQSGTSNPALSIFIGDFASFLQVMKIVHDIQFIY